MACDIHVDILCIYVNVCEIANMALHVHLGGE